MPVLVEVSTATKLNALQANGMQHIAFYHHRGKLDRVANTSNAVMTSGPKGDDKSLLTEEQAAALLQVSVPMVR